MALVDFHVHTPASDDFLGEGSTLDVLRACRTQGVNIVVLTDHNSLDGFLEVEDSLGEFGDMLVLPGLELTCRGGRSGIHLLALLDPSQLGKRPRRLLGALGLEAADRNAGGLSSLDVVSVCAEIHRRGGLVIAAHAASDKGILQEVRGIQLERTLAQCEFDAIELSSEAQHRRGLEVLERLGLLGSVSVVSGTDSHRAQSTQGHERPQGPGERATDLNIDPPWTFAKLKTAVADHTFVGEREPRSVLDTYRSGNAEGVTAIWPSNNRAAVTRAVAATATVGAGAVLVGVHRGGRGGKGIVVAEVSPTANEVENWIRSDVRPTPATEVVPRESGGRVYIEIKVLADLNPFTYSVEGRPLVRRSGRIVEAKLDSTDNADVLTALREAISPQLLERLSEDRPDSIRDNELEAIFPWRGYLTADEGVSALRKVAHWIGKGSPSSVLRSWALDSTDDYQQAAMQEVRTLTRAFTVHQAKAGIRAKVDEIGASRSLRRRVMSMFEHALEAADPIGLAAEAHESNVLQATCARLADAVDDGSLDAGLRDVAFDESQRTNELLGVLVSDSQVRVIVEAVVGELGGEAGDQIAASLLDSASSVNSMPSDAAEALAESQVALVSSTGASLLALGGPILALHAPVRSVDDLLTTHRRIAEFHPAHVIQRGELMGLVKRRSELELDHETQILVFRSCVRLGLPAWWVVSSELDLADLSDGLSSLIAETRAGDELARLLRCLALLPGDHADVFAEAQSRSRARPVRDLADTFNRPWEERVSVLVARAPTVSELADDEIRHKGDVLRVRGEPIAQLLREGRLGGDELDRGQVEALARQLKHVSSEILFDLLFGGVERGWPTASALRQCDEATYLPAQILEAL